MPKLPSQLTTHYRADKNVYLGIDPGKSGGLAALVALGSRVEVVAVGMPDTERDLWDWVANARQLVNDVPAVSITAQIEKVWGHIGQNQPGSAMFNFGASYGSLRMALVAANIPFEDPVPQRWQKALGIPKREKTETGTTWKNRLKAKAQQLFPELRVTLRTADALLLAEYCRRKTLGLL